MRRIVCKKLLAVPSALSTVKTTIHLGLFGSKESKAAYNRLIQEWKATGKSSSYGTSKPAVTLAMLMVDWLRGRAVNVFRSQDEPTFAT